MQNFSDFPYHVITECICTNSNCPGKCITRQKNYSNPVSDQHFFVELKDKKINDLKVALYNVLGEVVYSDKSSSRIEISISDLPNGVYIVKITSVNKKKFTSRIVKI